MVKKNQKIGFFKTRTTCRLCGDSDLWLFLDMGYMPLAGNFLKKEQIGSAAYFPLRVYCCRSCTAVQLLDIISFDEIFRDYRYLSSVSLSQHFQRYAEELDKDFLKKDDFIVEIGSNDGVLLQPLKNLGMRVLGIDPAENVAKLAQAKGLETHTDFFTKEKAKEIVSQYGQADAILANNVLAHIDDMQTVGEGITTLLARDGVLVFEVHYLLDLLKDLQYDFFYPGEHITYYSLISIIRFYEQFDMEVFDVKKIATHGGSIRVFVRKKEGKYRPQTKRLQQLLAAEELFGLTEINTFDKFKKRVFAHRKQLQKFLSSLLGEKKRLVGYGAAGRGNTLLNFCGIDKSMLEYIVDESPERYGRFTPGTHIPIVPPEFFRNDYPEYALILAWNYREMIIKKEKEYQAKGGKFIIPLPKIIAR